MIKMYQVAREIVKPVERKKRMERKELKKGE
jgi:hypothetical protein